MGIKSWVKKTINKILNAAIKPILNLLIIKPLKAILKAFGLEKFSKGIDAIFNIVLSLIGFFLNLITIVADLLEFIVKFFMIIIEIFTKIGYYITRPFKLLIILIKLFITFVTCFIGFVYHSFEIGDNLKAVELIIYLTILNIMYSFVFLIHLAYWVVWKLFVEYTLLRSIDVWRGGFISTFMYKYFIACENPPDAWYMTPGWHKGNKNTKYIFAYNPCAAGYKTNNISGLFCKKNSPYELDVCPQANLYRIIDGKETKGKLRNPTFNPNTQEYLKKNSLGKSRMITDYIEEIKTTNAVCTKTMKSKDTILKTYCAKIPTDTLNSQSQSNQLCYDIYCRNNKREAFCHKLEYVKKNDVVNISQSIESLVMLLVFITFGVLVSGQYLKNI